MQQIERCLIRIKRRYYEQEVAKMALDLLWIGVGLLILGIVFYALGARGLAGFTAGVGKLLLWIFLILFVITLILRFI